MNTYLNFKETVMSEIDEVLSSVDPKQLRKLVSAITKNNEVKVLGYAAGRMGSGLKAFVMRLNHLGIKASFLVTTMYHQ